MLAGPPVLQKTASTAKASGNTSHSYLNLIVLSSRIVVNRRKIIK